jgi:hypothetical protein
MPADFEGMRDPRNSLVRDKYFCVRPRPLERWLWSKRITASAERVFWLHWQEGMQRGDWCSEIPLSRVARECHLDVSTVTRAYQLLTRLGCVRRTDQGRDPANPFQQATALTEIRIPHELLLELSRHPNRRANSNPSHQAERGRAVTSVSVELSTTTPAAAAPRPRSVEMSANSPMNTPIAPLAPDASAQHFELHAGSAMHSATQPAAPAQAATSEEGNRNQPKAASTAPVGLSVGPAIQNRQGPADHPFSGLTGRERVRAISQLIDSLSPSERHAYQEALRLHQPTMDFDVDSKTSASTQTTVRQLLALMCRPSDKDGDSKTPPVRRSTRPQTPRTRKLTTFEIGRLSRDLQSVSSTAAAPELMRQVVWSIETGALKRFDPRHALHIALKKIREGQWTRPHRMPPNWARVLSNAPAHETCGHA